MGEGLGGGDTGTEEQAVRRKEHWAGRQPATLVSSSCFVTQSRCDLELLPVL